MRDSRICYNASLSHDSIADTIIGQYEHYPFKFMGRILTKLQFKADM